MSGGSLLPLGDSLLVERRAMRYHQESFTWVVNEFRSIHGHFINYYTYNNICINYDDLLHTSS